MPSLNIFKIITEKLTRFIETVSFFILIFIGATIILSSVVGGIYIPIKLFSVITASIGCCCGASIITLCIPKITMIQFHGEKEKMLQRELEIQSLQEEVKKVANLEDEKEHLLSEIERHKRMRVDVNSYRNVLKLGLTELDIDTYDFKTETLNESKQNLIGNVTRTEYIGVMNHKFKALFGVNLRELQFIDVDEDILQISGLKSEFQGMKHDGKNSHPWVLTEIRSHKFCNMGSKLPDTIKVISSNKANNSTSEMLKHAQKQEEEFLDRVSNGLELQGLQDHIIKMAQEFLRIIFDPLGKKLQFVEFEVVEGKGFIEYLEDRNLEINKQLQCLEEKKATLSIPIYT